jgi:predicted ester cyclase
MTREDILSVMRRQRQALASRDMDALGALYAEGADLESPLAGSVRGRDAVIVSFAGFLKAFPNAVFEDDEPIIDGDRVSLFSEVSGTDTGGIMGLPPSGRSFRFPCAFSLTIRDGKIIRERRVYDFTGLLVQVGALKAKPA